MRRLAAILLLAPTLGLSAPSLLDYRPLTERWVAAQLSASLGPPPNLDQIASILYGLVTPPLRAPVPALLERTAGLLRQLDPANLDCGQRVNLRFIAAFLRLGGVPMERLKQPGAGDCSHNTTPLDLASDLYLRCRFGEPPPPQARELARLQGLQRPDGGFGWGSGPQQFYLSSHAVFALHACEGAQQALRRGQSYLLTQLPRMQRLGFNDGLLEALLMLREMGVAIPGEAEYLEHIRARIRADGSLCRFEHPGCRGDWHASALLLALQRSLSTQSPANQVWPGTGASPSAEAGRAK
jgi:hypothetical protein